jgi:hypothetical protein
MLHVIYLNIHITINVHELNNIIIILKTVFM